MLSKNRQREATSQIIHRPLETVLVAEQPEEILSKALLGAGTGFEAF
jgi:hypothetical protein